MGRGEVQSVGCNLGKSLGISDQKGWIAGHDHQKCNRVPGSLLHRQHLGETVRENL